MKDKIKVIYISGIGRSGSTLLDLLISTNDSVFSVGEIYKYNELKKRNIECSCGNKFNKCIFWKNFVNNKTKIINRMNLKDYLKMINFLLNPLSKKINFKDKSQDYDLFTKIKKENPNVEYILDSSKDIARLIELDSDPRIEIYNISIIRDGRAVANSFSSNRGGKNKNYFISLLKWNFVNFMMLKYLKKRKLPSLIISYEEFCKNPRKYINKIQQHLNIKIPKNYSKKISKMEYHGLSPNRIAKKENRKNFKGIKYDDKWMREQGSFNKILGTFLTYPLNKNLVYAK